MSGVNTLKIFVSDIADVLTSFDVIRLRRSASETGPWTNLTSAAASAATMLGTNVSPFTVVGSTLQLIVDSFTQEDIIFTGVDPLSVDQVVDQINDVFPGVASDEGGQLRLTSTITGTQSKIHIVGGSAATVLGFTVDQREIGFDQYVTLVSGVTLYDYYDRDGGGATGTEVFFYQSSFFHTATNLSSQWSEPFEAEPGTVISASNLSVATVDLVDAQGVSVPDQEISFFTVWEPLEVENRQVGLVREPITVTTDNSGHAEVTLVRGVKIKAVFVGTSFVREFTVPDSDTFDLLGLMAAAPDPFNPYEPNYPTAPRRTL